MMKVFLRAKHWQLFLVTFGIPMLLEMAFFILAFSSMFHSQAPPGPINFEGYFGLFPVIMLLFTLGLFGWFWSIANGLRIYIPEHIRPGITAFKWFFFVPLAYLCLVCVGISYIATISHPSSANGLSAGLFAMIIIPLHLFSMFGIFYCMYFVAKTIKLAELHRPVTFSDFALEFFLIWFYPIGIWIVQPKINKMIAGDV